MLIANTPGHAAPANAIDVLASELQPPSVRSEEHLHIGHAALSSFGSRPASVVGALRPHLADRRIVLEALHGRRWVIVAHSRTGRRGRFHLRWAPRRPGSWPVQVRFRGGPYATPATHRLGRLSSYWLAGASWYTGSGTVACGGELTSSTMGVANKTLPCGTIVSLRYRGRTVSVPVIDRGPYVPGREYDLTEATKNALGFEGVGEVWASR